MFRDRFSWFISARVLVILAVCTLFGFVFARTDYFFSQLLLALVIAGLTYELIHYARRTSREISRFLFALKHQDYTAHFKDDDLGYEFRELAESFREILIAFQHIKIEKEAQFGLLQSIVDKINIGIIAVRRDGFILLGNNAAFELLDVDGIKQWEHVRDYIPEFANEVDQMRQEGKKLVELRSGDDILQFSVNVHHLVLLEQSCRIITFHDINSEIEQKEIEAWYKLIRVLTHEIMNSVTPLGSLTETILMILEEDNQQKPVDKITNENISDIRSSVTTIRNRSEGILRFVENYRKLTDIPHPEYQDIHISEFFDQLQFFFRSETGKYGIKISSKVIPEDLVFRMDPNLMEQVMINMITNSIYALDKTKDPAIAMKAYLSSDKFIISIKDNGKGIEQDKIDKIFIPFYSTREGGSGIGLSFSKHVIYLHQGRIKVNSASGEGTEFILQFALGE